MEAIHDLYTSVVIVFVYSVSQATSGRNVL